MARVTKTETCWLWIGAPSGKGYGQMMIDGRRIYVHRLAYELLVGPIPDGFQLDHLCRVKNCVNPAHLEPVTCQENIRRIPVHYNSAKSECPKGHPLSGSNLYVDPTNRRRCRQCRVEQYA